MSNPLELLTRDIVATIEQANAIATRVKSVTDDIGDQIDELITESDTFAEFRQWAETIREKIADATANLKEQQAVAEAKAREILIGDSDVDVEEEKKSYLALRSEITKKTNALKVIFPSEEVDAALADTVELIGFRGTKRGGGGGTPRPRLESAAVNGGEVEKPTFSEIAKVLAESDVKASAGDLIKVALETAGVKEWSDANGPQTFEYEGHTITWTPVN